MQTVFDSYRPGRALAVPVQNHFDHTNIDELKVLWTYGGRRAKLVPPDIAPHGKGDLMVPLTAWDRREPVLLEFFDRQGRLIESCSLRLEPGEAERAMAEARVPLSGPERPRLSEVGGEVVILCEGGVEVRVGMSVNSLARMNHISTKSVLRPGQRLQVAGSGPGQATGAVSVANTSSGSERSPAASGKVSYRVKRGDTLSAIARHFEVTVRELQAWNNMGRSTALRTGQFLTIHVGEGSGVGG